MSSSESFFTEQGVSISAEFSEFSLLPSQGYSLLVRAKRYGRWWLLKALKEPYRHDSMYQTLLRKEYEMTPEQKKRYQEISLKVIKESF